MIGFYDYTVILTYLSLFSAVSGIMVCFGGSGHPYIATFFLLICGLCDAFDGKVARTKKNRTDMEKNFGIQIDSLSDLVAFGVLPACIGAALIKNAGYFEEGAIYSFLHLVKNSVYTKAMYLVLFAVLILYVLAALIRLAYFNVTEEERQKTEKGSRKTYTGLPVTSSALIFPGVLLLHKVFPADISLIYFIVTIITGVAFLSNFKIKKAGLKGILIMVGIGIIEFILLVLSKIF